jgi:hypothetical protein
MIKRRLVLILLGVFLTVCGILALLSPKISVLVRERFRRTLSERFESTVEFSDFRFVLFPRPTAVFIGLNLLYHDRKDMPPLIRVAQVSVSMQWRGFFVRPLRIKRLTLQGLQITFPPRQAGSRPTQNRNGLRAHGTYPIEIERVLADDAQIVLLRADARKTPLVFDLHHLTLESVSLGRPAHFEATLTNAVPRGEIYTSGLFGPWDSQTPRETPIDASYRFDQADLSSINGLRGILSSNGTFSGPLDYLDVQGTTITPNFTLRRVANPMELRTVFAATVDGTNGNTYLHSVRAQFLRSSVSVKGEIADRYADIPGRTIDLDVASDSARAEDLIRLAVSTTRPVLKGPVKFRAKIRIPEEDRDLGDRLAITAQFSVAEGHFTNPEVQDKVDLLSRKAQGEPKNTDIAEVPSQLVASMNCREALLSFPEIRFLVPGARLELAGTYRLGTGDLDFQGNLLLDAKLSQTTTGPKSLFLKAIDPFFRGEHGGARIPVMVGGTQAQPRFGLGHGGVAKSSHGLPNHL